jgi:hypothetical protein
VVAQPHEGNLNMGIGISVLLLAVGAIPRGRTTVVEDEPASSGRRVYREEL